MASLKNQIGLLIRHHRKRVGLTQDQLAERSGRSVEMVNRVERGVTAASLGTLEAFSVALDTPLREFFGAGSIAAGRQRGDALGRLVDRVAGLDPEDIAWIDRLVATALSRKSR